MLGNPSLRDIGTVKGFPVNACSLMYYQTIKVKVPK